MDTGTAEWIRCPVCAGKTRDKMRIYTKLRTFRLFCSKCKQNQYNVGNRSIYGYIVSAY